MIKYVGFLRGINVGGKHKVSMEILKKQLLNFGCLEVKTFLNSGNIVFQHPTNSIKALELDIEKVLLQSFGFEILTIIKPMSNIQHLTSKNPFAEYLNQNEAKLYVSFLKNNPPLINLPFVSDDKNYQIVAVENNTVLSVLNPAETKSTKAMEMLEIFFWKRDNN